MPRPLIVALLLASTLIAQDEDDGKQATIDLRLDTSGHGELTVKIEGASGIEQFLTEPVRHALALGCEGPKHGRAPSRSRTTTSHPSS